MHHRYLIAFALAVILVSIQITYSFEDDGDFYLFQKIGPYGGDVRSLLIDVTRPSIVYLGSSNGKLFKTIDGGISWSPLKPGIGHNGYVVDTLVQDPLNPDHIYAGGWDLHSDGGGLFESEDGGTSWTPLPLTKDSSAVRGLAVCRNRPERMAAATLKGVFVSDNGGSDWRQVGQALLNKAESIAMDPVDCNVLYVGTWRLGYKSEDFGENWEQVRAGMPLDSDIFSIAPNPRNSEIVYAGACSGVYRSGNRASQWKRLRVVPDRLSIRAQILLVDPIETRRVYAGTTEGLFVSDNEGNSWRRITGKDISVNAVQVDPVQNNRILIGTEYDGIMQSEDGGHSWNKSNIGFIHQNISWMVPDPEQSGRYILGAHSGEGGMYAFDDEAGEWTWSGLEEGTRILSHLFLPDGQGQLAGTSQGVYIQSNRTGKWKKLDGLIADRTVYSLEIDASARFIFAGTDHGIYRSPVDTLNFRVPPSSRISPKVWCFLVPKSDPETLYAGTSLGLLRSWDKGTTWHIISATGLPSRVMIRMLAVSPDDNKHLFAATAAGLLESENGGVHWQKAGNVGLGVDIAAVLFMDDSGQSILAADKTSGGVFHSADGGRNWAKFFSSTYDSPVNFILKDSEKSNRFFVGTQSDGIYLLNLESVIH